MSAEALAMPSGEDCTNHKTWRLEAGRRATACWYPQMGGYHAKCIIVTGDPDTCFEAYVWHDGEFPFSDAEAQEATHIHHCDAQQFIRFGELVMAQERAGERNGK